MRQRIFKAFIAAALFVAVVVLAMPFLLDYREKRTEEIRAAATRELDELSGRELFQLNNALKSDTPTIPKSLADKLPNFLKLPGNGKKTITITPDPPKKPQQRFTQEDMTRRISSLESDNQRKERQIDALKDEIADHESEIADLKAKLKELTAELSILQLRIEELALYLDGIRRDR